MEDTLKNIRDLSAAIASRKTGFDMRRRLNPHHSKKDVQLEYTRYDELQRHDFFKLKALYVENREDLLKLDSLTKNDRDIFSALDSCVADDLERELLEGHSGHNSDD